jgi:hypothetical protein
MASAIRAGRARDQLTHEPTDKGSEPRERRSTESCPVCGAFRLAVLDFPELSGSQWITQEPAIIGRGTDPVVPAIGCLACGAEWRDLDAFRQAKGDEPA